MEPNSKDTQRSASSQVETRNVTQYTPVHKPVGSKGIPAGIPITTAVPANPVGAQYSPTEIASEPTTATVAATSEQKVTAIMLQETCYGIRPAQQYDIKDVKAISKFVGTRTPTQVRTHAQKWLLKQKREWKIMQQQQQQAQQQSGQSPGSMKQFRQPQQSQSQSAQRPGAGVKPKGPHPYGYNSDTYPPGYNADSYPPPGPSYPPHYSYPSAGSYPPAPGYPGYPASSYPPSEPPVTARATYPPAYPSDRHAERHPDRHSERSDPSSLCAPGVTFNGTIHVNPHGDPAYVETGQLQAIMANEAPADFSYFQGPKAKDIQVRAEGVNDEQMPLKDDIMGGSSYGPYLLTGPDSDIEDIDSREVDMTKLLYMAGEMERNEYAALDDITLGVCDFSGGSTSFGSAHDDPNAESYSSYLPSRELEKALLAVQKEQQTKDPKTEGESVVKQEKPATEGEKPHNQPKTEIKTEHGQEKPATTNGNDLKQSEDGKENKNESPRSRGRKRDREETEDTQNRERGGKYFKNTPANAPESFDFFPTVTATPASDQPPSHASTTYAASAAPGTAYPPSNSSSFYTSPSGSYPHTEPASTGRGEYFYSSPSAHVSHPGAQPPTQPSSHPPSHQPHHQPPHSPLPSATYPPAPGANYPSHAAHPPSHSSYPPPHPPTHPPYHPPHTDPYPPAHGTSYRGQQQAYPPQQGSYYPPSYSHHY